MGFNFRPRSLQGLRNHILCCRRWKEVGSKPVEWYILSSTAIIQVLIPVHGADPIDRVVLGRGSAAARLLGLRLRIPPEVWMSVSCWVLCVVMYSSLRRAHHSPKEIPPSVVRVTQCDREASTMKRPCLSTHCRAMKINPPKKTMPQCPNLTCSA